MKHLMDNVLWNCLSGPYQKFAVGTATARRYAPGFSPIWSGPAPDGWHIEFESTMFKMVWEGETPTANDAPDAVVLGAEHAVQALELGDYFGFFEGERLVAMAGERFQAGPFREISGVCPPPSSKDRVLRVGSCEN